MTAEDRARVEQIVRFHELWAPDIEAWRERLAALRALLAAHDRLAEAAAERDAIATLVSDEAAAGTYAKVEAVIQLYEAACASLSTLRQRAERAEAEVARLKVLAKEATNALACVARAKYQHDEVARLHQAIDALAPEAQEPQP